VGAGLLVRSYTRLTRVDPGFRADGVLTATLSLPRSRYDSTSKLLGFFTALEGQAAGLPGVTGAASVSTLPLTGSSWSSQFAVQGRPPIASTRQVRHRDVTPGYEQVMGVPLKAGRLLAPTDDDRAPSVVLVNEAFVREFFPAENPVGLRIAFDRVPDSTSVWRTIVGVVGDERVGAIAAVPEPEIIAPLAQETTSQMTLVVRTTGDPAALAPAVRGIVARLDPALAISSLRTMESVRSGALARDRFLTTLMLAFALIGVALGAVGVYGVVAQLVRRRMREMGIRMALGAVAAQVQWIVVRRGLALAAAGVAVGLVASAGATRLIASLLFGVTPTDAATFAGVALLLLGAALAASWIPARLARRAAPTEVLRAD
jgi:putative ABC transport system permease protein